MKTTDSKANQKAQSGSVQRLVRQKIPIFDTGLNTEELSLVRKYLIIQYPELGNSLIIPDKNTVPSDLVDRFEFVQPKQKDEFHAYHRQLYTHAKQYMASLDSQKAPTPE